MRPSGRSSRSSLLTIGSPVRQDLLFVVEGLLRVFGQEEIEIGQANKAAVVGDVEKFPHGVVDQRKPSVAILEVDAVGRGVHQRHEQVVIDLWPWTTGMELETNQRLPPGDDNECHQTVIVRSGILAMKIFFGEDAAIVIQEYNLLAPPVARAQNEHHGFACPLRRFQFVLCLGGAAGSAGVTGTSRRRHAGDDRQHLLHRRELRGQGFGIKTGTNVGEARQRCPGPDRAWKRGRRFTSNIITG